MFLPVSVRGDANVQLEGIASVLRSMPQRVQPVLSRLICAQLPSSRGYEELLHVNAVPKAKKWIEKRSGGVVATIKQTIGVDTYEVSLEINADDYADDRVAAYQPLAEEMLMRLLLAPDELVSTILVAGGTALPCFDGSNFYATGHKWPGGEYQTNQSNLLSGSGANADNIETDFYSGKAAILNWKDDRGVPRVAPEDVMGDSALIVHFPATAAMMQNMNRVFGLTKGGDAFDIVVTGGGGVARKSALAGQAVLVADPHLTDTSDWYIHSTKSPVAAQRPFAFIDREAPHVTILGKGTEHYEKENTVLILGKRRFGLGVLRPERSIKINN